MTAAVASVGYPCSGTASAVCVDAACRYDAPTCVTYPREEPLSVGDSVVVRVGREGRLLGRVTRFNGDAYGGAYPRVVAETPHGSVVTSGCVWVRRAVGDELATLRALEDLAVATFGRAYPSSGALTESERDERSAMTRRLRRFFNRVAEVILLVRGAADDAAREAFYRADQRVVCSVCNWTYGDHVHDPFEPWLTVLCSGERVKL